MTTNNSRSVTDAIGNCLADCGYYELQSIVYQYERQGSVLTLRGRVSTYYLKQLAQALVAKIEHVQRIVNLLEVNTATEHSV